MQNDPGAVATHVSAVAGCYLPWHWARWTRDHLLCVRVLAPQAAGAPAPRTAWSGGFRIDAARSLHVACREGGAAYVFVRVEVVPQGCSLFVVLSDAEAAPAPLRLDNLSPVAVMFHQAGCAEEAVVGAHASVRWALPEPEGRRELFVRAPDGPRTALPLDALPAKHQLVYQNFIYVAFVATRAAAEEDGGLVLEVPLGSARVVLGRKRYGDRSGRPEGARATAPRRRVTVNSCRSQLWRRGPNDQLIHEGSTTPQPMNALRPDHAALAPDSMASCDPLPARPAGRRVTRAVRAGAGHRGRGAAAGARVGAAAAARGPAARVHAGLAPAAAGPHVLRARQPLRAARPRPHGAGAG